jgi:hypothetical protein
VLKVEENLWKSNFGQQTSALIRTFILMLCENRKSRMSSNMSVKLITVVGIHGCRLPDTVKVVFLDGTRRSNVKGR